ncbi:hypothetical protein [Saccharibacillus brassicae]|uniref:Uncharacterized protein n=1 Tax=Saccharibacillus brassicae TaxID=2583377 RepID=A0A4Y6UWJ5_SACBS|nr:hypothetical protein [Saccharibacillus brassicae]QDH21484.1 hypothetical protein FFV09_11925 [Saccharibacillus brassicae]
MSERKLSGIELFAFDVMEETGAGEPRRSIRRYGLLKLSCGSAAGYGACLLSEGFAPADPVRWSACCRRLRGLTPGEAASAAAADRWGECEHHTAQYALIGRALADLLRAQETRRASARLLIGLGAAGLLGGLAARVAGRGADALRGPAAGGRAHGGYAPLLSARHAADAGVRAVRGAAAAAHGRAETAPAGSAGGAQAAREAGAAFGGRAAAESVRGRAISPDDMPEQLLAAVAAERPSSFDLMDRADAYCAWF